MFSLTISFGPGPVMWTLMWRDKQKADAAMIAAQAGTGKVLHLTDEFGQNLMLQRETIHGVMLEDMELSKLAHIERALHQARMQAKGQEMAEADSTLRQARARQGPAILSPMGGLANGGFGQR